MIDYYIMIDILSAVNTGLGIAGIILILILSWIVVAIPVYLAAKLFGSDASFSKAMGAILLSEIVAVIIIIIFLFISITSPVFTADNISIMI
jgi:hypothetical protein